MGNVSNLRAWAVLVQSDGSYSTLSPVVHGDIAPSIKKQIQIQTTNRFFRLSARSFLGLVPWQCDSVRTVPSGRKL